LQLRWVAVVGQLLTIATSHWIFHVEMQAWTLIALVGITAITNTVFWLYLRQFDQLKPYAPPAFINDWILPTILLLDMNVLTAMLYYSGGPTNPFLFFYFVNVAIGSILLHSTATWLLVCNAVIGFLFLLNFHQPIPLLSESLDSPQSSPLQRFSFFIAFVTCCLVVTHFIRLLYQQLLEREQQLRRVEQQEAKVQRLEALATLAAGAAHELATPLSTIAVVAKELSRSVPKWNAPDALKSDLILIQDELKHCRTILDRMRAGAGEAAGEHIANIAASTVIDEILVGIRDRNRITVDRNQMPATLLQLPLQAIALAIRNVVQNALDASPIDRPVRLAISSTTEQGWEILVIDQGYGMPESVLQRLGEPFFTTKEPGKGMGLGVYLTHNVIYGLGGSIRYESQAGEGTTAHIILPPNHE
jgi:two-component system sensor histidine kinase RegB